MTELIIIGTGGLSREILWLYEACKNSAPVKYKLKGFIGPDKESHLLGIPILGDDDWALANLDKKSVRFVVAIGDPKIRSRVSSQYESVGFSPGRLIHPSAQYSQYVSIGPGAMICAGCVLTTQVVVGRHTLLNLNVTVGHDCNIGNSVTVSPGANISGNVSIGDCAEIGSNSSLLPGVKVGERTVLGAGAVATSDLMANKTYIGIPAKEMH